MKKNNSKISNKKNNSNNSPISKESAIMLKGVAKFYQLGEIEIKALDDINLRICNGEYISIMGPSGSGKTTLLDVLSTMLKPSKGQIFIEGKETTKMSSAELAKYRGTTIGFIFQTFNLLPKLSALENVIVPLWINGMKRENRIPRAKEVLKKVGLEDRMYNKPNQLSGGQRQRVAIARALALDPNIIVADEPTGNLDSTSGKMVMEILNKLHKDEKKTVILVTHDQSIGKKAKRKILLKDGKIISKQKDGICQL